MVCDKFQNSTLPEYIEETVRYFDKLTEGEKKIIIQTIIAEVIIDPEHPDQIKIRINPDPKGAIGGLGSGGAKT